jgi:rare lipoprotein A
VENTRPDRRIAPTVRPAYVAVLCLVTLVAGFLVLRNPREPASTAIRAGSQAGSSPASADGSAPQTPAATDENAATISLSELAGELRARNGPPTTRPSPTTTTVAKKSSTTTSTRPPPTTTTTAGPQRATTPPSTTPLTPLTTLLDKVVPPAVAVAGTLTRSDSGVASWFNAPDATCAHRTLPLGTVVKVTRTQNGASATCKVNDRGPTLESGRVIDLSLDTFQKLASREAGLIDVRIEW